ncbi:MAG: arsenite methyltransferase [Thermincola sp.]|nr:arsenite methyltransferase [Thermincola sp.]MDT3702407.1 arsenite methyltransferase [Thermincola sp.]
MNPNFTTKSVREAYAKIAKVNGGCGCGCSCSSGAEDYARGLGYTNSDLSHIPAEANLALSCGNPTAIAELKEGETVLDLGSGAGFDCFLAAARVGAGGRVVGVDMTPEMIEKARGIADGERITNVEFRLGEIENLPAADNSVDVVISNCVINLSADKSRVFREIHRVLKPGGRVAISDVVLFKELPTAVRASIEAYVGCIAGAVQMGEYEDLVKKAGLRNVKLTASGNSFGLDPDTKDPRVRAVLDSLEKGTDIRNYVASVYIEAEKK